MCIHYWKIGMNNEGVCKLCGLEHDFNRDNKQAFPEDYIGGCSGGLKYKHSLAPGEFYMQGSLRLSTHSTVEYDD